MFVKNEKKPSVTMFNGRARMFRIGFRKTSNIVKAMPPKKYVGNPPLTFTPEMIWVSKKMEKALNKTFRKNPFIIQC